ncbi:PREDICTED: uncharacterized protein LOC105149097 [Acromyrmex echinatior]|uniref:uncharacterized protein LOC105149097 n=1 Tax=Acromyrmex echinatior TaxID=103372 RepID=UPI000580D7C0|nr:PREDICTED: uncharacterized protein LOC105149097 [Acromyrmex echinatior]
MIHLEIQYFSFNRILLLVIGLWPYQQSKFTRFQFILISTILTAGIVFQTSNNYTHNTCRYCRIFLLYRPVFIEWSHFITKYISPTNYDGVFYRSRKIFLFNFIAQLRNYMHRRNCDISSRNIVLYVSSVYLWNVQNCWLSY